MFEMNLPQRIQTALVQKWTQHVGRLAAKVSRIPFSATPAAEATEAETMVAENAQLKEHVVLLEAALDHMIHHAKMVNNALTLAGEDMDKLRDAVKQLLEVNGQQAETIRQLQMTSQFNALCDDYEKLMSPVRAMVSVVPGSDEEIPEEYLEALHRHLTQGFNSAN